MDLDAAGGITRKLQDAPLKDTVLVPNGGYTVIRFTADNPGTWHLGHGALGSRMGGGGVGCEEGMEGRGNGSAGMIMIKVTILKIIRKLLRIIMMIMIGIIIITITIIIITIIISI